MAFIEDFKKFAFKGNVVDLAVGVVIGGAFGKIVSALVADLVMPIVALDEAAVGDGAPGESARELQRALRRLATGG